MPIFYRNSYYSQECKKSFLSLFNMTAWVGLENKEKEKHSLKNCTACAKNTVFYYLRRNARACQPPRTCYDEVLCTKKTCEHFTEKLVGGLDIAYKKQFGVTYSNVMTTRLNIVTTKSAIQSTVSAIGDAIIEKNNIAVLSNNISYNSMSNMRKDIILEHRDSAGTRSSSRSYKHKHHGYVFDRDAASAYIQENQHRKIVWREFAKHCPVRQRDGLPAVKGPQALKHYAEEQGYLTSAGSRKPTRTVKKLDINGVIVPMSRLFPSDQKLKDITKAMIANGEIDIGYPIVPITISQQIINEDGELAAKEVTTRGRGYSLQIIMDRTLLKQELSGLLRKLFPLDYGIENALKELSAKGIHVQAESVDALNMKMRRRLFVVWHDHSTVASKSHFLVLVSFIYDPLSYLTSAEFKGQNIEYLVERPHLYMFARSQSSVKHQALYTSIRVKDFIALKPSRTSSGTEYQSVPRIGIGDSPARAFESGNQVNGHFPCHCGADARMFNTHKNFEEAKYKQLRDRVAVINITRRWQDRQNDVLEVFDNLDVRTLKEELQQRSSCDIDRLTKPALRDLLDRMLSGIRRPPALLCTDLDINISGYEVCHLEPLHDLKNIIGHIIREMFYVVSPELKEQLQVLLGAMHANYHEISGCNARSTLLKLRCHLETSQNLDGADTNRYTLQRLLTNLSHIQELAYNLEKKRTMCRILAMYNLTYMFFLDYVKLFHHPKSVSARSMFGMPFHSLTSHFPEWFRIVSLRSLNAEHQERVFKDIKSATTTTNFKDNHLITNTLIRLQVKAEHGNIGNSFLSQQSKISRESSQLRARSGTIITRQMVEENVAAFAAHKHRIADYLLDGFWHSEDTEGNWQFYDGEEHQQERASVNVKTMHIRENNIDDVWRHINESYLRYEEVRLTQNDCVEEQVTPPTEHALQDTTKSSNQHCQNS